jgi:hypothetical protein
MSATTKEKAKQAAESTLGYSYNADILSAIVDAGYLAIPDGVSLMTQGEQVITLEAGAIICRKDGIITKTTPITTPEMQEQVLIMYAVKTSRNAIHCGN